MTRLPAAARPLLLHGCLAAAYAAATLLGRAARAPGSDLSLIWPAAAVAAAWVAACWGSRARAAAALAGVVVLTAALGAATATPWPLALLLGLAAAAQALVGCAAYRALHRAGWSLRDPAALAALAAGAVAGSLVGALLGAVPVALATGGDPLVAAGAWALRCAVSTGVLGALALAAREPGRARAGAGRLETAAGAVATAAGYGGVFWALTGVPVSFALLPLTVWVAVRSTTRTTALHVLVVAVAAVAASSAGHGPFAAAPLELRVALSQLFVGVVATTGLVVALHRDEAAGQRARAAATADLHAAVLDATLEQSVIGVGLDGRITVFNTGAERLTGWSAQEALGRSAELVHDPAELQERRAGCALPAGAPPLAVLAAQVRPGQAEAQRWTYVRRDGGRRAVDLSLTALRDATGALTGYLGVATDVTARLEVQRQLADSEELFRLAFDTAPTGMAVVCLSPGTAGLLRRANPAFARFTGRPLEALVERLRVRDLLHPDDVGDHDAVLARIAGGAVPAGAVERRFLTAGGEVRWGRTSTSVIHPSDGSDPYLLCLIEDVTERRAAQDALLHLASHDVLTGLPNRALVRDHLDLALAGAARTGAATALLFVDLDGFKAVNDTHGHAAGDALLREVAARLAGAVRGGDTVARLGGDEFAVLCPVTGAEQAQAVAARVVARIGEPVDLGGGTLAAVGASVGVAVADGAQGADHLLGEADRAMYAAKRAGGRRAVLACAAEAAAAGPAAGSGATARGARLGG